MAAGRCAEPDGIPLKITYADKSDKTGWENSRFCFKKARFT